MFNPALPFGAAVVEGARELQFGTAPVGNRMVFGQPRQDDLLAYLMSRMDVDALARILEGTRIDLSPTG